MLLLLARQESGARPLEGTEEAIAFTTVARERASPVAFCAQLPPFVLLLLPSLQAYLYETALSSADLESLRP